MTLEEMRTCLQQYLPDLRQRYGVRNLWLFGSYVRAEQTENSDLDVLVTFENPHLSLVQFIQLEQELCALLGIKVDLVEREALKPTIGQHILQEVVAI
ncbi:MAG: nucleotidyltransferase family protein [Ardenticatenaceae bacterium]|nr:nucleotidyltransferase family protein [Ardenticatenaceae bacterium]MCB8990380.1 nucleotidyltransferase family protein [Ardenticatenaceae bacterium]